MPSRGVAFQLNYGNNSLYYEVGKVFIRAVFCPIMMGIGEGMGFETPRDAVAAPGSREKSHRGGVGLSGAKDRPGRASRGANSATRKGNS